MKILVNFAALRQVRWYEHFARFLLGGFISLVAGLIAKEFGPTAGGLFLAFPAIFPASATLLDKHEREKKQKAGIAVTIRGLLAVGLDARGAADRTCVRNMARAEAARLPFSASTIVSSTNSAHRSDQASPTRLTVLH
jgi:hypothetical protein